MKIVLISDTHTQHRKLTIPECDILIHAGDISDRGELSQVYDFINWFADQPAKHCIFIAGNHDWSFTDSRKNKIREVLIQHPKVIYLEDSEITIEGIKFYGSPWTPTFYNWAFNADRGKSIAHVWEKIPYDTDILIIHGPPYGYGDKVPYDGSVGCEDLLQKVLEVQPNLVIFGHIHGGRGMYTITRKTTAINASVLDDSYILVGDPIVIDYDDFTENALYLQNN